MLLSLDGPARQVKLSLANTTATFVQVESQPLSERKVITLQPLDGNIKIYFAASNETPTAAYVLDNGFTLFKNAITSLEAADTQRVFISSIDDNCDVILAERA